MTSSSRLSSLIFNLKTSASASCVRNINATVYQINKFHCKRNFSTSIRLMRRAMASSWTFFSLYIACIFTSSSSLVIFLWVVERLIPPSDSVRRLSRCRNTERSKQIQFEQMRFISPSRSLKLSTSCRHLLRESLPQIN